LKIEISHDALAKEVYERASTDDKMRLKVGNFIHTKYQFYKENNKLLEQEDLHFIEPYLNQLVISKEERTFVDASIARAKNQQRVALAVVTITIIGLLWLVYSNHKAWVNAKQANIEMEGQQRSIMHARDSIQDLLNEEYRLKEIVQDNEDTISKNREELAALLVENKKLLYQLQIKNRELDSAYTVLEMAHEELQDDNQQLEKSLKEEREERKKAIRTLSSQEKSLRLSKKAQLLINANNEKPSEEQIKKAFLLSRAAWEMSPNNNQAMDVLNDIKHIKIPSNNGAYLDKDAPKYTYSTSKIQSIIRKLGRKYGKLSNRQIEQQLR